MLAELRIRSITDGIATINIVIEPDKGGDAVRRGLAKSRIRERARLVRLGPFKDASALHIDDPARFADRWREAISAAVPWREEADREAEEKAARAKEVAGELVSERDILGLFAKDVERAGGRRS